MLTFTNEEIQAVLDSKFFYIKHSVTEKLLRLFGELEKTLTLSMKDYYFFSSEEIQVKEKGKIFRGENYRKLPYILLDCPRLFSTGTVFAFRSMFWWGKEFSFTLHLQGQAQELFRTKLTEQIQQLRGSDYFICVNSTPWEYHFEADNYQSLDAFLNHESKQLNRLLIENPFIKISRKLSIEQHADVVHYGNETFNQLMKMLK
jgi:hypothetical protein